MARFGRTGLMIVLLAAPLAAQAPSATVPSRGVLHLAVDTPASDVITPVPIGGAGHVERGVVYDFFRIEQLTARAAVAAGRPIDPAAPPPALLTGRLIVVAYPMPCPTGSAMPVAVALSGEDGHPVPAIGAAPLGDDALGLALPGATIPPGSRGAAFGEQYLSKGDTIGVTYDQACEGGGATFASPPVVMVAPVVTHQTEMLPAHPSLGAPARVRVEAIVAGDGRPRYPSMLAGPQELESATLEAISQWTFEPGRANGVMVPFTFETTFLVR